MEAADDATPSKATFDQATTIPHSLPHSPLPAAARPVRILLTGFGPFKTHIVNPSFEILASLRLEPFIAHAELIVHPEPVRVAYRTVRGLLPRLFASHPRLDYVIHLGVSRQPHGTFKLEQGAHRVGYNREDVDGIRGCELEGKLEEGWEDWSTRKEYLSTSVEVDRIAEEVQTKVQAIHPNISVSTSSDAGRYLCEYIFYTSLAHFEHQKKVLFLHVPPGLDSDCLAQGRDVLEQLVWTLIQNHDFRGPMH